MVYPRIAARPDGSRRRASTLTICQMITLGNASSSTAGQSLRAIATDSLRSRM